MNLPHNQRRLGDKRKKNWRNLPQILFRREGWETNVKKSWGNRTQNPENLFRGQRKEQTRLGDKCWGNPPQNLFSRLTEFAPRNARGGGRPETFTMAKDLKANAVGEKGLNSGLGIIPKKDQKKIEVGFVSFFQRSIQF